MVCSIGGGREENRNKLRVGKGALVDGDAGDRYPFFVHMHLFPLFSFFFFLQTLSLSFQLYSIIFCCVASHFRGVALFYLALFHPSDMPGDLGGSVAFSFNRWRFFTSLTDSCL